MAPTCANPIYLSILQDYLQILVERESRSADTYRKGIKSLKLCPIKFVHPDEAGSLAGIGPGIIKTISIGLEKRVKENGGVMPEPPEPVSKSKAAPKSRKRKEKNENGMLSPGSKKAKLAARINDSSSDEDGPAIGPSSRASTSDIPAAPSTASSAAAAAALARSGYDADAPPSAPPHGRSSRESSISTASKSKDSKQPKMYVPAKGSGGYAILLALISNASEDDSGNDMTKTEIIELAEAKGWSSKSFKTTEKGKYHTAWNSMSTLTGKGLVCQTGRPARFSLSDTGYELAKTFQATLPVDPYEPSKRDQFTARSQSFSNSIGGSTDSVSASSSRAFPIPLAPPPRPPQAQRSTVEKFGFHFVDKKDEHVSTRTEAAIRCNDEGEMERRIEFRLSQRSLPFVVSNVVSLIEAPIGRDIERTIFGWVAENMIGSKSLGYGSVAAISSGSTSCSPRPNAIAGPSSGYVRPKSSPPRSPEGYPPHSAATHDFGVVVPPLSPSSSRLRNMTTFSHLSVSDPSLQRTSSASSVTQSRPLPAFTSSLLSTVNRTHSFSSLDQQPYASSSSTATLGAPPIKAQPIPLGKPHSKRLDAHMPNPSHLIESDESGHIHRSSDNLGIVAPIQGAMIDPLSTVSATYASAQGTINGGRFPHFDPIVWPAGSYEIILLLDTREVKSQRDRSGFFDRLKTVGVRVEQRALPVGDMLWIARVKGGLAEDECVLDFVVERKRLDDLTNSVRDGRFREQKFRLRNSALTQVMYLIEDFDNSYQNEAWGTMIATAVSSTQIIDGYFVKRTIDLNSSIDYLQTMHRTIEMLHQDTNLYIIPDRMIARPTYLELQKHLRSTQPSRPFQTTYPIFASINSKSGSTTLKDTWCKMLLTISGLSPEKVSSIVESYPTPISLWRALKVDDERYEREVEELRKREGLSSEKERERLIKKVRHPRELLMLTPGVGRRAIGKALSTKVYDLFRSKSY